MTALADSPPCTRSQIARPRCVAALAAQCLVAALSLVTVWTTPALACGGFFVEPSATVVNRPVETAERVLFVADGDELRTWLEVRHEGKPTSFAWLLPVDGEPTVELGTRYALDRLDQATAPRFITRWLWPYGGDDDLPTVSIGCGGGDAMSGDGGAATTLGVTVLSRTQVGPYDVTVIHAQQVGALKTWLETREYALPALAEPILQDHIDRGHQFVAMRLTPSATHAALRPIIVRTKATEPCMPLRLTSISAAASIDIVATFIGPHRAVPRNMMHAHINPVRLDWFDGVSNYQAELGRAVSEAGGRAFVTEFSGPSKELRVGGDYEWMDLVVLVAETPPSSSTSSSWRPTPAAGYGAGPVIPRQPFVLTGLGAVANAGQLARALTELRFPISTEVAQILEEVTHLAPKTAQSDLTAWYREFASSYNGDWCSSSTLHYLCYDVSEEPITNASLLRERLEKEFVKPLLRLADVLDGGAVVTRLATRMDKGALDRDPTFGWMPGLPAVSNEHMATLRPAPGASGEHNLTLEALGTWRHPNPRAVFNVWMATTPGDPQDPVVAHFPEQPSLIRAEVFTVDGKVHVVAAHQRALVDEALKGATATQTLPPGLVLDAESKPWQPPASTGGITLGEAEAGFETDAVHCGAHERRSTRALGLLLLGMVVLVWRRRRAGSRWG